MVLLDPREIAALASSLDPMAFAGELLERLERVVGCDVASHAEIARGRRTSRHLGPEYEERITMRGDVYSKELMPVKYAALARHGVAVDSEVFAGAEREQLRYYQELVVPQRGRHSLMAYGTFCGAVVSGTMLGRTGSRSFSARDIASIEAVLPVIGLATAAHGTSDTRSDLTPREREIVAYLRLGYRNTDIARALGLSPNTVRNQLAALYEKLGAANRAEAVARTSAG
jgi:DNA-binding CsgD family transcriptional regulator